MSIPAHRRRPWGLAQRVVPVCTKNKNRRLQRGQRAGLRGEEDEPESGVGVKVWTKPDPTTGRRRQMMKLHTCMLPASHCGERAPVLMLPNFFIDILYFVCVFSWQVGNEQSTRSIERKLFSLRSERDVACSPTMLEPKYVNCAAPAVFDERGHSSSAGITLLSPGNDTCKSTTAMGLTAEAPPVSNFHSCDFE